MIDKNKLKAYCADFGIEQSDEVLSKLDTLSELLIQWNEKINLTAITDSEGVMVKHMFDSLTLLRFTDIPAGSKVIDVGCGAGFPSLPLLIAKPEIKMTFLDGTAKKLKFIDEALNKLNLKGITLHERAEQLGKSKVSRETYDFATARAVAALNKLCELTLPLIKPGGSFIALKGKEGREEAALAENALKTLGGEIKSINEFKLPDGSDRTIIIIKKISHTPTKYPRASTLISKKPL